MQWQNLIERRFKQLALSVAVLTLGTVAVQQANASCLQFELPKKNASNWQSLDSPRFMKASYEEFGPSFFRPEITGMWAFKYISKGNMGTLGIPDDVILDGGNTIWFADGNEVTTSGVRDPTTGNTCMGIWKQTGRHTYVLNHVGLGWNPPGNAQGLPVGPSGPAFIRQYVTLDRDGNSYTGTFTINQLKPDGKTPALPALIKGMIVATRININTDTEEP